MKELKDMKALHPTSVSELSTVMAYYPFEWNGHRLRCVPVKNTFTPCRLCHWEKVRNVSIKCPMTKACIAHYREDKTSVKFISDELSSMNFDEEAKMFSKKIDELCYKK